MGAALEASPVVSVADAGLNAAFDGLDPAEVFRTSAATLQAGDGAANAFRLPDQAGVAVEPRLSSGHKCARCWRVLPEVTAPKFLCERCDDAVAFWDAANGKVEA